MKKTAYYSDLFFAFSLIAFCALFLLRAIGVGLLLSLVPACAFGLIGAYLLSLRLRKKRKIFTLKKSEEAEKERLFFYLTLSESAKTEKFLQERLPLLCSALRKENALDEEREEPSNPAPAGAITCEEYRFFPRFSFRELSADDVAELAKRSENLSKTVILCDAYADEAVKLCDKLGVKLVHGDYLYRVFKDGDVLSEEYPLSPKLLPRPSRRKICFAKSNWFRFFKSGVLLSACSFLTPFSTYYTIAAFIFFGTSAFIKIFGYR